MAVNPSLGAGASAFGAPQQQQVAAPALQAAANPFAAPAGAAPQAAAGAPAAGGLDLASLLGQAAAAPAPQDTVAFGSKAKFGCAQDYE